MKKIYIVALCLMLVFCFTACVEAGEIQNPTETKPNTTEPTNAPSEPGEETDPMPTVNEEQWESDIDISEFETVPEQIPTEPEIPAVSEPEETEPTEPAETLSPTDEENFQRPMVKP